MPPPAMLPPLLLLAGAALLPAQQIRSHSPVHRLVWYEVSVINQGDKPLRNLQLRIPLPQSDRRQQIHHLRLAQRHLHRCHQDHHGQELADYLIPSLAPGDACQLGFIAGVSLLHEQQLLDRPPGAGIDLPAAVRERYLAGDPDDQLNYSMHAPALRRIVRRLRQGAESELQLLRRIHGFVCSEVRYHRDGRWDPAEMVLRRGSGSCSEFNYLLSGLCRLAGLPTRAVGATTNRFEALPYTDTVFHRWTEVFLRGRGWVAVDSSRGADPARGATSQFGRVFHDVLVWSRQGGGRSDSLGWEYRARLHPHPPGARLRLRHRARWFAWQPLSALESARTWLQEGRGPSPDPDLLECCLLDVAELRPPARRRLHQALIRARRASVISQLIADPQQDLDRPLATLGIPATSRRAVRAAPRNLQHGLLWRYRLARRFLPTTLRPLPNSHKAGGQAAEILRARARIRLGIRGNARPRVLLAPPSGPGSDRAQGRALATFCQNALAPMVQAVDPEDFAYRLSEGRFGPGDFLAWAMNHDLDPGRAADQERPEWIAVPLLRPGRSPELRFLEVATGRRRDLPLPTGWM